MLRRLGSAIVLIGLILLIIAAVTLRTAEFDPIILLSGSMLCIIGLIFRRRGIAKEREYSGRFQTVRKLLQRDEFEEEE